MSDHKAINVNNCELIKLNKIKDPRGNITFLESNKHIPFEISRVYYLYDTLAELKEVDMPIMI